MKLINFLIIFLIFVLKNYIKSENKIITRSFGSRPAARNQFPYQALIFIEIGEPGSKFGYRCSGALITQQHVITVAHCLYNLRKNYPLFVILGTYDQYNYDNDEGSQIFKISSNDTLIHINYDKRTEANDLALIKLPRIVEFNQYIQPISLPDSEEQLELIGHDIILSGWGEIGNNGIPRTLHYIITSIISSNICWKWYGGENFNVKKQICINKEGSSGCRGDSGSPYVLIKEDFKKILVGIHSYANEKGCDKGFPQVAGRITYYLKWIYVNTKNDF